MHFITAINAHKTGKQCGICLNSISSVTRFTFLTFDRSPGRPVDPVSVGEKMIWMVEWQL